MSDDIKIKIGADGATQAAAGVDKLTASLEKQRKTAEMIRLTQEQLKRQNIVDQLKKEAAEVNNVTASLQRQQQVVAGSGAAIAGFGNNTQQLRAKLGPAAALIGNLGGSISTLVPELTGLATTFQRTGMAAGQMLGVLGGGPGIIIGGLIAGVTALATYMSSAKQEADELAKATEANAKALGSYLDQLQKLRSEVTSARQQKDEETGLQSALDQNKGTVAQYKDEIDTLKKRLESSYYKDLERKAAQVDNARPGEGLGDVLLKKRLAERQYLEDRLKSRQGGLAEAQGQATALGQQQTQQRAAALDFEVAGTPDNPKDDGKNPYGPGYGESQAQLEKLRQLYNDNENKMAEDARRSKDDARKNEIDAVLKDNDEKMKIMREHHGQMDAEWATRQQKINGDHAVLMKGLAADRRLYQDPMQQMFQVVTGSAIKAFQLMAKGQKAQVGMILEGIGDQAVAMGSMTIFDGIAKSILLDARGPALIGVGSAEVAFGLGLGAAGAGMPGGSNHGGGGATADNPFSPRDTHAPSPLNEDRGPTVINIHMSSTLTPNPDDAIRMKDAFDKAFNVYGSAAVPNYAQR